MKAFIEHSIETPRSSPNGLAWDGECIWAVDGSKEAFRLDPADGKLLARFDTPGYSGLEWCDGHLLNADHRTQTIYKLNPVDGSVAGSFPAAGDVCSGIAWDGRYLWNADHHKGVARIDPRAGRITSFFQVPGERTHGLAFDGSHLWFVDADTEEFYEVALPGFEIAGSFQCPAGTEPHGLTWDGQCLWYSDASANKIHRLRVEKER